MLARGPHLMSSSRRQSDTRSHLFSLRCLCQVLSFLFQEHLQEEAEAVSKCGLPNHRHCCASSGTYGCTAALEQEGEVTAFWKRRWRVCFQVLVDARARTAIIIGRAMYEQFLFFQGATLAHPGTRSEMHFQLWAASGHRGMLLQSLVESSLWVSCWLVLRACCNAHYRNHGNKQAQLVVKVYPHSPS